MQSTRIIKREVKPSTDPEVIAMNHQEAIDKLTLVTDKMSRGTKNHKKILTKVQEDKFQYSQKIARAKLMKEVSDIEKNQQIGRYMLPGHLLDENSREDPEKLEDKDKMGKN